MVTSESIDLDAHHENRGRIGVCAGRLTREADGKTLALRDDRRALQRLRRACEVSETEVNVQLGELTLNQNQMSLLESAVARHPDFVAVFGEGEARYSCAEVERREHRRWVRVLGADFDVQIWSADPSVQPFTVKRKGGGDASDYLLEAEPQGAPTRP